MHTINAGCKSATISSQKFFVADLQPAELVSHQHPGQAPGFVVTPFQGSLYNTHFSLYKLNYKLKFLPQGFRLPGGSMLAHVLEQILGGDGTYLAETAAVQIVGQDLCGGLEFGL